MTGPTPHLDGDVIVVGAGPVGMTAAILLARAGVSVIVLEQQSAPSAAPKAISLDDESLRSYQAAGVIDAVLQIIVPGTGTVYYGADGAPLFQARGPAPYRLGHPFKNPFAQPDLERVLRDVLVADPDVDLRYGTRAVGIQDGEDAVTVLVESAAGTGALRAGYLIGADGGRSTVRERLGITMTGRSHLATWIVIDTLDDDHDERFGMHHGDPARPHVIVPGLDGRCRYEFHLFDGEGAAGDEPPFALMRRLLAPYRDLAPHHVERAVNYRFNGLNADSWRSGRTFLAGDAAHMMPPFAGQGLNSGIRDVTNLCWKLAGVIEGVLRPHVLESYESERREHAAATIRLSERLGRIVMTTSPALANRRDALLRTALRDPAGRRYFEEMRYRPAVALRTGLVVPGDSPRTGRSVSQPRVFDTALHEVRMFDEVLGAGWAVIGVDIDGAGWSRVRAVVSAARATALHIATNDTYPRSHGGATVVLDLDGRLTEEFAALRGMFVLVRPDRIVSAVWRPDDTATVESQVTSWFTRSHDSWATVLANDPVDAVVA